MKFAIISLLLFSFWTGTSQVPKSGKYIYKYCDEEYNKCLNDCKVEIKGDSIWIYAPANLTLIKEGELMLKGKLFRHKSGKWMIVNLKKEKNSKIAGGCVGPPWIDFKRKRFWSC